MLATASATSSRNTPFLRPKPPPTSSDSTRIFSIGTPSWAGINNRTMCGDWVAVWNVSCSFAASQSAIEPRHSIGTGWCRCTDTVAETTRSALANAASMSPMASSPSNATLSPSSSKISGFRRDRARRRT